jgi:hypothetical protein
MYLECTNVKSVALSASLKEETFERNTVSLSLQQFVF